MSYDPYARPFQPGGPKLGALARTFRAYEIEWYCMQGKACVRSSMEEKKRKYNRLVKEFDNALEERVKEHEQQVDAKLKTYMAELNSDGSIKRLTDLFLNISTETSKLQNTYAFHDYQRAVDKIRHSMQAWDEVTASFLPIIDANLSALRKLFESEIVPPTPQWKAKVARAEGIFAENEDLKFDLVHTRKTLKEWIKRYFALDQKTKLSVQTFEIITTRNEHLNSDLEDFRQKLETKHKDLVKTKEENSRLSKEIKDIEKRHETSLREIKERYAEELRVAREGNVGRSTPAKRGAEGVAPSSPKRRRVDAASAATTSTSSTLPGGIARRPEDNLGEASSATETSQQPSGAEYQLSSTAAAANEQSSMATVSRPQTSTAGATNEQPSSPAESSTVEENLPLPENWPSEIKGCLPERHGGQIELVEVSDKIKQAVRKHLDLARGTRQRPDSESKACLFCRFKSMRSDWLPEKEDSEEEIMATCRNCANNGHVCVKILANINVVLPLPEEYRDMDCESSEDRFYVIEDVQERKGLRKENKPIWIAPSKW